MHCITVLGLHLSVQPECDGQTDRQTDEIAVAWQRLRSYLPRLKTVELFKHILLQNYDLFRFFTQYVAQFKSVH